MSKMLMFTLAISCLPTSNLPRFMDLTFQVAMQYWFLQHWTLLPSLVTSLTGFFFFFFALALSLHCFWSYFSTISSSIGHLPTWWVHLSVSYLFAFILFIAFSRQEYWSGLPFPSPVDHVLSELSTMSHLSWLSLHGMTHSFIGLDKVLVHVIRLVSFLSLLFPVSLPSDGGG